MQQDMKQRGQLGGVLQYLSDEAVYSLIKNLSKHIKKNGLIISRDILAFEHRFFSSNDYPCVYRTKNELFDLFRRNGFSLLYSKENMFPPLLLIFHGFLPRKIQKASGYIFKLMFPIMKISGISLRKSKIANKFVNLFRRSSIKFSCYCIMKGE